MTLRTLYQYVGSLTRSVRYHSKTGLGTPRREAPSAPPMGELLSEREAEGVRLDKWNQLPHSNRMGVCYVGALYIHSTTPPQSARSG